jgi:hypothetical protein
MAGFLSKIGGFLGGGGGAGAAGAAQQVTGATKFAGTMNLISQGVGLGTGILGTIAGINDSKKRLEIQENLEKLSIAQRDALERDIQSQNTTTQKIAILTNAVTMIKVAEVSKKLDKTQKDNTKTLLLIIGGGVALLATAVVLRIMLKK